MYPAVIIILRLVDGLMQILQMYYLCPIIIRDNTISFHTATTAVCSAASGNSFSAVVQKSAKAAVDGFADGFMAGGIAAGASQVASGGFKIAAKLGAKTGKTGGINLGNTKILSPDAA